MLKRFNSDKPVIKGCLIKMKLKFSGPREFFSQIGRIKSKKMKNLFLVPYLDLLVNEFFTLVILNRFLRVVIWEIGLQTPRPFRIRT